MKRLLILILIAFPSFTDAQMTLQVNCYWETAGVTPYYNAWYLDSIQQDYGIINFDPSFFIGIIDSSCTPWQTNCASLDDFGNEIHCFSREYKFFKYSQSDSTALLYLDSLINYWIPNDHAFFLYTPISYNGPAVDSLCPTLGQTISSRWGINAITTQEMVVLFGVQGYPNSYAMDTTLVNGTHIEYNVDVCPHYEQIVNVAPIAFQLEIPVYPNPGKEIKIDFNGRDVGYLMIYDNIGQLIHEIEPTGNDYTIGELDPGIYYVSILNKSMQLYTTEKLIISP